jgi:hypothetical protein
MKNVQFPLTQCMQDTCKIILSMWVTHKALLKPLVGLKAPTVPQEGFEPLTFIMTSHSINHSTTTSFSDKLSQP